MIKREGTIIILVDGYVSYKSQAESFKLNAKAGDMMPLLLIK